MADLYKEITGDITEPKLIMGRDPTIITHVCNNIGKFGAGVAKAIAERWPLAKHTYDLAYKNRRSGGCNLGDCQFTWVQTAPGIIIANMVAQDGVRGPGNPTPIKYEELVKCMVAVRRYRLERGLYDSDIHCPKFGSGLAGGDWRTIKFLIKDIWCDHGIPVTVYGLE